MKLMGSRNNTCLTEKTGYCYSAFLKKVNVQDIPLKKVKVPLETNQLIWEIEVFQEL